MNQIYRGVEKDLVRWFCEAHMVNCRLDEQFPSAFPISHLDTVVTEMAFKFGRADIVVFHIDGSASVIEAKNGSHGYNHVVAGIGQAGLYAAQLAMNKGALTCVRKCLMWTSTGDIILDALIQETCLQTRTVPIQYGPMAVHIAAEDEVYARFGKVRV